MGDFSAPGKDTLRVAIIGVGARGPTHLAHAAAAEGTTFVGVCDVYEDAARRGVEMALRADPERHKDVKAFFGDEHQGYPKRERG